MAKGKKRRTRGRPPKHPVETDLRDTSPPAPAPPSETLSSLLLWQLVFWTPAWVAMSVAISATVSTFASRIDDQTVLFSSLCALLPIVALVSRHASFPNLGSPGAWGWLSIIAFLMVAARLFIWGTVEAAGAIEVLLPNNLGDASLHLALVNFLASSPGFWPMSPWFAPSPLEYPLGADLFDAMMVVLLGRPPLESMVSTSLVLSAALVAMLWGWSRAFGVALLLFCAPMYDLLLLVGKTAEESAWKSLVLTVLAPQRGMLVALPLGLSFLVMARRLCPRTPYPAGWSSSLMLFLPLAPLPLFSVHSTLALLPVAAWTAVILGRRAVATLFAVCALALAPSAWAMGLFSRGSHIRLEQFACSTWSMEWPACMLKNFGLLLPLLVWLFVQGIRGVAAAGLSPKGWAWDRLASIYFPSIFLVSLFVAVSPWTWDNTKLMLWGVVGAAPFVWSEVLARFPAWFRVFSVVLLILPGAGALHNALNHSRHGYEIARAAEVREASAAMKTVPPGSVLAAAPDYNHPWFLAGHAFFLGYEGWLWSHGLDSSEKKQVLNDVLGGAPGWENKAKEHGITHIIWSDRERKMTGRESPPAGRSWPAVFKSQRVTVYAPQGSP